MESGRVSAGNDVDDGFKQTSNANLDVDVCIEYWDDEDDYDEESTN